MQATDVGYCFGCNKPSADAVRCDGCSGVFWCRGNPACATEKGWTHDCLCKTWSGYASRREDLITFPFEWSPITCADELRLSETPYAQFLHARGLAGKGWWKTELQNWVPGVAVPEEGLSIDVETQHTMRTGFAVETWALAEGLAGWDRAPDGGLLVPEEEALEWGGMAGPLPDALDSWEAYYSTRGLSPTSPAALVLTFSMSLFHIVTRYGDAAAGVAKQEGRPFRIHLVGCEKEIHIADSFAEFGRLLFNRPGGGLEGCEIELTMVVRADCVPPRLKGRLGQCRREMADLPGTRLTIEFAEGSYGQDLNPDEDVGGGPPDMIVGFNAGLYAYKSWTHTVLYVLSSNTLAVFTDYNEHSGTSCAKLGGAAVARTMSGNYTSTPHRSLISREISDRLLVLFSVPVPAAA